MIIQHAINKGLAEVEDELGKKLCDAGEWVEFKAVHSAVKQHPKARRTKFEG